jgi:hypothetical protein
VRKELLVETVIVGGSAVVAGEVLRRAGMRTGNPVFWFSLGALTHLGWEALGGNRWYIESRDPADFPKGLIG